MPDRSPGRTRAHAMLPMLLPCKVDDPPYVGGSPGREFGRSAYDSDRIIGPRPSDDEIVHETPRLRAANAKGAAGPVQRMLRIPERGGEPPIRTAHKQLL